MPQLTRITRDARVVGGKPCIRGMRVTVGTVVVLVAAGHTTRPTLAKEHGVTRKVEAIYTGGVLKPTRDLCLEDQQRVRLTVETIDEPVSDREAAVARLKAGIASMHFFSGGPLPSREELHDRD